MRVKKRGLYGPRFVLQVDVDVDVDLGPRLPQVPHELRLGLEHSMLVVAEHLAETHRHIGDGSVHGGYTIKRVGRREGRLGLGAFGTIAAGLSRDDVLLG